MSQKLVRLMLMLAILFCALILATLVGAQVPGATLSGTVKDPTGAVVAKAKITVKSVATGQSAQTETDSAGHYRVPNLPPGDYELSISAEGYSTNVKTVTVASGSGNTADVTLAGVLTLGDLGLAPNQTQGSAQDQAKLDKRSHMLKIHQRIGLIDTAPLIATVILGLEPVVRRPVQATGGRTWLWVR
jgi:Carboxypeptidase regulatory-like domain